MIRKLRKKFIASAMLSLLIIIVVIIACIDIVMDLRMNQSADAILQYIAENNGEFPKGSSSQSKYKFDMTQETPFSTRFFSVTYLADGSIESKLDNIAAIDEDSAENYAARALVSGKTKGRIDEYRYLVVSQEDGTQVIFLDCYDRIQTIQSFFVISVFTGCGVLIVMFILVTIFSKQALGTTIKSMELQKQFITDAGHEIKTPLAIISADADVLEIENGKSKWLDSIRHQTEQLSKLIKQLLTLSKLEETDMKAEAGEYSLSDTARGEVESIEPLAVAKGMEIKADIEDGIKDYGSREGAEILFSVLLENAVKYAAKETGDITLSLKKQGRGACIEVRNPVTEALPPEELKRIFGRFYRADSSRNQKTGGHGIGLSIAAAIVEARNGRIQATMIDDKTICFSVYIALGTR